MLQDKRACCSRIWSTYVYTRITWWFIRHFTFENHIYILYWYLLCFKNTVIQVNVISCEWPYDTVIYMVFVVTHKRINPQPLKLRPIMRIQPLKMFQLRCFIGWLLYTGAYERIFYTFYSWIKFVGHYSSLKCMDIKQKAFEDIKNIVPK